MKIIIHAGTHKTATTSFQALCARSHKKLLKSGILYPIIKHPKYKNQFTFQHSIYARDLSRKHPELTKKHFQRILESASKQDLHTLLLSGEDFENILIDRLLLDRLLNLCAELGIAQPTLAFTVRDPFSYFCSLYNELSNKNIGLDFKQLALTVASTGYLAVPTSCSTDDRLAFNNFFAIDASFFIKDLKTRHPDLKVLKSSFTTFTRPKLGLDLMTRLFDPIIANSINFSSMKPKNKGISNLYAEINYVKNFLHTDDELCIKQMSLKRLESRIKAEPFVQNLFSQSFNTP